MRELISVIIPVYNVEKYIDRCVESVINQTYKNLEIILVDDGSSDMSLHLCNKWEKEDKRVKVLSKENGGASTARNAGIDSARGNYIMFVDSDDYVSEIICESLYIKLKQQQADIAICRMEKIEKDRIYPTRLWDYSENMVVMNRRTALQEFFMDKIDCGPCHKLFSAEVIKQIRFPEGVINEDFVFVYRVLLNANRIVFFSDILYHYCFRENSVTSSRFSKRQFDRYYNCVEVYNEIKEKEPELEREARFYMWRQSLYLLKEMLEENLHNEYLKEFEMIRTSLKKDLYYILKSKYLTGKEKVSYCFLITSPIIYKRLH